MNWSRSTCNTQSWGDIQPVWRLVSRDPVSLVLLGDQIVPGGGAGTPRILVVFGCFGDAARDDLSPRKAREQGHATLGAVSDEQFTHRLQVVFQLLGLDDGEVL